jgi:hypothetical protein
MIVPYRSLSGVDGNDRDCQAAGSPVSAGARRASAFSFATIAPPVEVEGLVSKLRTQKCIVIDYEVAPGANHFWAENLPDVEGQVGVYLDRRLAVEPAKSAARAGAKTASVRRLRNGVFA